MPAGLTILAVIAAIQFQSSDREGEKTGRRKELTSLSTRNGRDLESEKRLSRREIVEQFPDKFPIVAAHSLAPGQEDQFEIFSRVGALEGEAAVDLIFEKYQKGQSAYLPMTFAMIGWMETDLETALAAFKGFLSNRSPAFASSLSEGLFQWKGVRFHSGLM